MLTWAAVVAVFFLMNIGNIVSATGSGLACPDWPLCHGQLIPPLRPDILIEYSHRLANPVAAILLVATVAVTLYRSRQPAIRRICWALLLLLPAQIALGGITVLLKLPDLVSTSHLLGALLILGGLLVLAASERAPGAPVAKVARLARIGLAVLLVQLALGGYVRHSGAGLACPDFPLCSGHVFPGHWLALAHWTHRWLGVAILGFFVHLAVAARGGGLAAAAGITAALAGLQVCLGIATVLLQLAAPIRAAHAAVGYALWGTLVWTGARAGGWRGALARPGGRAEMAEAGPA